MAEVTQAPGVGVLERRQRRAQFLAQGVLAAVGVAVTVESLQLRLWTTLGPGPGFFPFVLGLGLVGLAGIWAAQTLQLGRRLHSIGQESTSSRAVGAGEEPAPTNPAFAAGKGLHNVRAYPWIVTGSLLVVAALINVVGFQIAMLAFLLFHLRVMGRNKWRWSILIALVGSVGAFHLFSDLLLVPLPYSMVPFLAELGI